MAVPVIQRATVMLVFDFN